MAAMRSFQSRLALIGLFALGMGALWYPISLGPFYEEPAGGRHQVDVIVNLAGYGILTACAVLIVVLKKGSAEQRAAAGLGFVGMQIRIPATCRWAITYLGLPDGPLALVLHLSPILVLVLPWLRIARPPGDDPAWTPRCRHCGYCLRGLDSARCPECGTAFDPE